jgi:shikimate dehydrogenase
MIGSSTSLFGIIGNPVAHSLSPIMQNQAFAALNYDAVYLAFEVVDPSSAVAGIKALNIRGVSVTIPHKIDVMKYLDKIDETAAKIGAVNTIVNRSGILTGYNTDCEGCMAALRTQTTIQGKSIALIGAGGAARAIGFGLVIAGGRVTILNRSRASGEQLASDLKTDFLPLNKWEPNCYDILINATPIGMYPEMNASPIPEKDLSKNLVVMDIVYNPLKTRLLREAEAKKCRTISGVSMFVFQGAYQFELWTGKRAPVELMEDTVLQALKQESIIDFNTP